MILFYDNRYFHSIEQLKMYAMLNSPNVLDVTEGEVIDDQEQVHKCAFIVTPDGIGVVLDIAEEENEECTSVKLFV